MKTSLCKIWIEAEEWAEAEWNPENDNSDVVVTFENGDEWVATFFTYSNILSLAQKNQNTGENLEGKYFWASDMILVDELSRERIEQVISDLLKDGQFESVFAPTSC